jgi:hypothetical protein
MKKSVLRTMIREEVAKAIQEVITELKQPTLEKKPKKKKVIREKQNFTSNKILNNVLNETADNVNDWETMGGTQYTSDRMGEIVGNSYKDLVNDDSGNANGSLAVEMGVNPNDPAAAFLKKDYRKLMKKVEEKKGKI